MEYLTGVLAYDQSFGLEHALNPKKKQSSLRKFASFVGFKDRSLLKAAAKGDLLGVQAALKRDIDIDCKNGDSKTALTLAVEGKHGAIVDELIQQNASQNSQDKEGWTPLMYACKLGDMRCVVRLLNHRADLDKSNRSGYTALCVAIEFRQTQVIKKLLEYPLDVNKGAPLALAAQLGLENIVRDLIQKDGVKVNGKDKEGVSAMAWAIRKESISTADEILNSGLGLDINEVDSSGHTFLHTAVANDSERMTKYLLHNHAKILATSLGSPLHLAVGNGNTNIVQLLMLHGANIDHERKGLTAVWLAVSKQQDNVLDILLSHEQQVSVLRAKPQCAHRSQSTRIRVSRLRDLDSSPHDLDSTPCLFNGLEIFKCNIIHMAVAHGAEKIALKISERLRGACNMNELIDLRHTGSSRNPLTVRVSMLHIAAAATGTKLATRMVKFLCHSGLVDVNSQIENGTSALHIAALGHVPSTDEDLGTEHTATGERAYQLMRCLVQAPGVQLNVQDKNGRTPLHYAVEMNQRRIAKLLLENGADPNIGDNDAGRSVGRTALHYAANDGHAEMADLIVTYGGDKKQKDREGTTPGLLLGEEIFTGNLVPYYAPRMPISKLQYGHLSVKFFWA